MPSRIYELGNTAGSPLRRISIIIAISCNASCPLQLLLLLIIMIFLMIILLSVPPDGGAAAPTASASAVEALFRQYKYK